MKNFVDKLNRDSCVMHWKNQFGCTPPKHASVQFMRKAFAFEAQVAAHGGHSSVVRNLLRESLKGAGRRKEKSGAKAIPSPASLHPGTFLVREWNGRKYEVEVTNNGFQMDGKLYGSLSGIAREITGTAWSGPRFFGLAKA